MDNTIRILDLHRTYVEADNEIHVLRGINLEIIKGEILAIVGTSGVGKSTLLHLIGGLDRPTSGTIFYGEQNIFDFSEGELDQFRNREIGFVFQFHHLLSDFTAHENVALAAMIPNSEEEDNILGRADELLNYVGLADRRNHYPTQLSGGERQRVAIARSLINQPRIVLADEPTGNLDQKTGRGVLDLLWDLSSQFSETTLIVITHDHTLAQRADRCVHLIDGKISTDTEALN
ncbi:ABC transporter ATP-binding protein [Candidatus Poribacteria bacterium]|nr:ABC transporter ATP-binding protein [Candidatus Poribacteria bacterium]